MSKIFDPDWKPGKRMLAKAAKRAQRHGIPFDQALAEQIADSKAAARLSLSHNARSTDTAELREETKLAKQRVYPKPQSVRAVPTATETNRRKH